MLNHKGTVNLYTKRLVLRRFKDSDAHEMYNNWCSDERVARYTTWYAHKSVEQTKQFLEFLLNQYQNNNNYCWAIEMDGKILGDVTVCEICENTDLCGIGYCLGYSYWGKGIATEATKAVVEFLFEEIGCRRIIAGHDGANIGSGIVMQNIGMKHEGSLKEHILRKDSSYGDDELYGLLKKDYQSK